MPNIATFNAPASDTTIQPNPRGSEVLAESGARAGQLGRVAGQETAQGFRGIAGPLQDAGRQISRFQTVDQVSQGAAGASAILADQTQKWQDITKNTDPNDLGRARQDFLQNSLQPALDRLTQGFGTPEGQAWAASEGARLADHFNSTTLLTVARGAHQAFMVNVGHMQDGYAAALKADPSLATYQTTLASADTALSALTANTHGLSPEDAQAAKTTLVANMHHTLAQVMVASAMDQSPQAGLKLLADPSVAGALTPQTAEHLTIYGRELERMQASDQLRQVEMARIAREDVSDATSRALLTQDTVVGPDGTVHLGANFVHDLMAHASSLTPNAYVGMARLARTSHQELAAGTTDLPTLNHVYAGIASGQTTIASMVPLIGHGLTVRDFQNASGVIDRLRSDPNAKMAATLINNFVHGNVARLAPPSMTTASPTVNGPALIHSRQADWANLTYGGAWQAYQTGGMDGLHKYLMQSSIDLPKYAVTGAMLSGGQGLLPIGVGPLLPLPPDQPPVPGRNANDRAAAKAKALLEHYRATGAEATGAL